MRPRAVVIILMLLSLAFAGFQAAEARSGRIGFFEETALSLFSPVPRAFHSFGNWVMDCLRVSQIRRDSENLLNENLLLKRRLARLHLVEAENRSLRKLLDLPDILPGTRISAEVVSRDPAGWFETVTINRGSKDGVSPDQGVIGAQGVVGRVSQAGADFARVTLLTNPNIAVPVEILPSGAQGILYGAGDGRCVVKYVTRDLGVKSGDPVMTSSYGRIFGKGIPVGTVTDAGPESQSVFMQVRVKPAAPLSGLEAVYVIEP